MQVAGYNGSSENDDFEPTIAIEDMPPYSTSYRGRMASITINDELQVYLTKDQLIHFIAQAQQVLVEIQKYERA